MSFSLYGNTLYDRFFMGWFNLNQMKFDEIDDILNSFEKISSFFQISIEIFLDGKWVNFSGTPELRKLHFGIDFVNSTYIFYELIKPEIFIFHNLKKRDKIRLCWPIENSQYSTWEWISAVIGKKKSRTTFKIIYDGTDSEVKLNGYKSELWYLL